MVKPNEVEGGAVPQSTIELLNRTLYNLEELETQLPQFLSHSDPDYLFQLPLLRRAHSLISLAKLTSTLFSLKLKCRGVNPNDHPFKSELDRVSVCQNRLERLPNLSEEEWQDMVEQNLIYHEQTGQKRKYPSSEEQPDQYDSKEFVEKLTGELLGDGNSGSSINEAIIVDLSDDDDDDDEYM
ncbi:uncharacterized protein LOC131596332 [Vicia villosa]|uniref:uncharacterized protein LOC131596332 n=1 Tax=Vicia villosa TaxID=3911 RepID=UPI00273B58C2|nr:uncharacterized protein LOC131596332 [Vicia villosa]